MSYITDKIGMYLASGVAVVLAVLLGLSQLNAAHLGSRLKTTTTRAENAEAQRDVQKLLVKTQSDAILAIGDLSKSKLDSLSAELAPILKRTTSIEAKADKLLKAKPVGANKCERWEDADRLVRESLR